VFGETVPFEGEGVPVFREMLWVQRAASDDDRPMPSLLQGRRYVAEEITLTSTPTPAPAVALLSSRRRHESSADGDSVERRIG
jgi:hypothetical protein